MTTAAQSKLEPLLTRRQVAALAQVSVSTVDREIRRGRLEAYRLGRSIRIGPAGVRAWLATR